MKQFLKKRWHRVPVGIVTAVLALVLVGGGVLAAYPFAKVKVDVTVAEAIVLGYNWAVDDLDPYMEPAWGVVPDIILTPGPTPYDLTVTIEKKAGEDASEFCPGETLIIPLNLRNRSDGTITVDVTKGDPSPLVVQFSLNATDWYDSAHFAMAGHQGTFGSDMDSNDVQDAGSTCLYIKVHAPEECPIGTQTFELYFSRS